MSDLPDPFAERCCMACGEPFGFSIDRRGEIPRNPNGKNFSVGLCMNCGFLYGRTGDRPLTREEKSQLPNHCHAEAIRAAHDEVVKKLWG